MINCPVAEVVAMMISIATPEKTHVENRMHTFDRLEWMKDDRVRSALARGLKCELDHLKAGDAGNPISIKVPLTDEEKEVLRIVYDNTRP